MQILTPRYLRLGKCLLALAAAATLATPSLLAREKPNILLVMADDLGWSDIGCYGNELIDTPNLNALSREGMRFTRAYAMPVCTPTRVSIQSGKNPATLKIQHPNPHNRPWAKLDTPRQYWRLPLEETTIAEALGKNGYVSLHVGKWGSGYTREAQGYLSPPDTLPTGPYASKVVRFEKENPHKNIGRWLRQAVRFIEENQDQPFYCAFSPLQVHTPLEAPEPVVEKYKRRFATRRTPIHPEYAAMVEVFDNSLGLLLEVLDTLELTEDTLVVFYSDNGGLITEWGHVPAGYPELVTHNWPLRGEKGTLYEGGIRVPLVMRWPGRIAPGSESQELVACYDFLPTFCDITGTSYDPSGFDGISIRPALEQSGPLGRDRLYWHYPRYHHSTPSSAIISGSYKLIHFYEDQRDELYDLDSDPGERFDLSQRKPALARQLHAALFDWLESVEAAIPQPNPNFDAHKQLIWGPRDRENWQKSFALPD